MILALLYLLWAIVQIILFGPVSLYIGWNKGLVHVVPSIPKLSFGQALLLSFLVLSFVCLSRSVNVFSMAASKVMNAPITVSEPKPTPFVRPGDPRKIY